MSLYDYRASLKLSEGDPPFAALIMSALRKADTANALKLQLVWPEIYEEFVERYNAPGGVLSTDPQRFHDELGIV